MTRRIIIILFGIILCIVAVGLVDPGCTTDAECGCVEDCLE